MNKILPAMLVSFFLGQALNSQTVENSGKPIAEIFTDFHKSFNKDTTTGFGLTRAFFGYNYLYGQKLSATLMLNIGNPDELPEGAESRRYAYVREASFSYLKNNLNIIFGITTTRLFGTQQRFWGKRYLAEPFETLNDYGYNADLGVVIDYKLSEIIKADLSVTNGEGYSSIQLDNSLRTAAGITITPCKQMMIRLYGDILKPNNFWNSTFLCFIGFSNDLVTAGAEVIYQTNHDLFKGNDAWGISGTGSITIFKKTELFTRYDYSSSDRIPGENTQWEFNNYGSFLISGIQYIFNNNLKMSLNYRETFPIDQLSHKKKFISLNSRFFF